MGLIKSIKLSNLSQEKTVRFDVSFIGYTSSSIKNYYTYKDLFDCIESEKLNLLNLNDFKYVEIGNITKDGEIYPVPLSFNTRSEKNENYFKKIEKGDILKPKKDDILLSSVRPYLNKNVLIQDEDYYFTKALIQIRPKKIQSKIFYYSLRGVFFNLINTVSRQGKSYPTLKIDDLKAIKFPKLMIDKLISNQVNLLKQIKKIEKEIQFFKSQKKDTLTILNNIFSKEFSIDLTKIKEIENSSQFTLKLEKTIINNDFFRMSYKWYKLETLQSYMYQNLDNIKKLGNFIVSTKNGWSPQSSQLEEGTPVLGQEHILKNGNISLSASKYTQLTKNNINDFYIQKDDFFVSRGNTIELVALAGIVTDPPKKNIIYPDLYIKIDFDTDFINKQYIAYLFNSFIGRVYFKYVSKGKNQTMVKISSKELLEFYLPIPKKTLQQKIVEKIKTEIDIQSNIDTKIQEKRKEINTLIENTVQEI